MTPCSRFVGATTPKQLFSQRRGNSKKLRRFLSCPACGDGGSAVVTMVVGMRLRTRCASFGGGWRCGSLTRARGGLDEYSEGARCFYGAAAKRPPIEARTYVCRPRRPHDRLLHDAGPAAAAMSDRHQHACGLSLALSFLPLPALFIFLSPARQFTSSDRFVEHPISFTFMMKLYDSLHDSQQSPNGRLSKWSEASRERPQH